MHHVTIITGKQGSGKTAFAKHYVAETSYTYIFASKSDNNLKTNISRAIAEKIDTILIDEVEFNDLLIYLFEPTIKLRFPYNKKTTPHKMPQIVIVTQTHRKEIKSILKLYSIKNYTLLTIN